MMDEDRGRDDRDDQPSDERVIGEIAGPGQDTGPEAPSEEEMRWRRRRPWVLGCLLAILGGLLGAATALMLGRGCETPPPEGAVIPAPVPGSYDTRLVFSAGPEQPERTPDIIPAETSVVFCFYRLGRVSPQAPLTARWWLDGEELGALELRDLRPDAEAPHAAGRFTIYPPTVHRSEETPVNAEPSAGATATEARPPASFPPGIYEVEMTSPEHPDVVARGSFLALPRAAKILQGGGEPAGPPVVRSLTTGVGIGNDGAVIGRTTLFPPTVRRIYAAFEYQGVPPGAVLTVRWFIESTELRRARAEIPVAAERGRAHAWLEVEGRDRLPDAQYQVRVYLGDEDRPLASTGFRISTAAPPLPTPPPATSDQ